MIFSSDTTMLTVYYNGKGIKIFNYSILLYNLHSLIEFATNYIPLFFGFE
jgi:hypothetical protein